MSALTVLLGGCSCARRNTTGDTPDKSAMSQDSYYSGETDKAEDSESDRELNNPEEVYPGLLQLM